MTATPESAVAALLGAITTRRDALAPSVLVIDGDPSLQEDDTPTAGQVAVFMVDRGVPTGVGIGAQWRETEARIEVMAAGATAAIRRPALRALLDLVEGALAADRSLGGVIVGCDWMAADPSQVAVDGADDYATEVVMVTLEYLSTTQL
jgi:hypothetical protein